MSTEQRTGALDGIRVVDLTSVLMGPMACRMLGDHGADVIQIVPPGTPESVLSDSTGMGGISLDIQRNKRSMTLDLKSETGQAAMWELLATADVLVTNMRAKALDRLGFSAEAVRKLSAFMRPIIIAVATITVTIWQILLSFKALVEITRAI